MGTCDYTLGQNGKKFGARARRTSFAYFSTMASPHAVIPVPVHTPHGLVSVPDTGESRQARSFARTS